MSARCLQSLQECPRVFELRLEVGCCAHRFTSFSMFQHVVLRPSRCVSPAHLVLVGVLFQLSNAKFVSRDTECAPEVYTQGGGR